MSLNHQGKTIAISALIAVIVMALSYISTNANISITGEKSVLKYWCSFTDWITSGRDKVPDEDVVFINVANDKQLVDVADEFGIPIGNAAITDRAKLVRRFTGLIQRSSQ